jgi:FkbM family methyltransferase
MRIVYIDIGLHKEAREIEMMRDTVSALREITGKELELHVYGYEAHPSYTQRLEMRYSDDENIHIRNAAICDHNGTASLFLSPSTNGEGNSIHSSKNNVIGKSITVPARKLSSELINMLKEQPLGRKLGDIVILRFNIEGAELMMMEDLIGTNTHRFIDIYCGAPSDIPKVHAIKHKHQEYQDLLESAGIKFIPFHAHYLKERESSMIQSMEMILRRMIDTSSIRREHQGDSQK